MNPTDLWSTVRLRLRGLRGRDAAERELEDEISFHIEMQTEEYVRRGMGRAEARRQAVLLFGGVEGHKEACRDARPMGWAPGSWLDLKMGLRMLRKYPGLTLVGGLGMAVAIAIGAEIGRAHV